MRLKPDLIQLVPLFLAISVLVGLHWWGQDSLLAQQLEFDRSNLRQFFETDSFDNDLVTDAYLIPVEAEDSPLVNTHLLGLQRDRLAYRARSNGEVVAVAVPATAEDGFNGVVELLISVDMFGRIGAARVIEDLTGDDLYGTVATIESKWMEEFSGATMRDILGISWSTITADREYDQFVGASITPKAVSNRIYDALVFYQSNRIELMRGASIELQ
ncbi:MAG: hypothetical protein MI746_03465 [Pseudomonadales bacterium]|nr:hypothetical protein [Pseudomonadales bacterium]